MSEYAKKNRKGRYYIAGKKYSGETYASIFEMVIQYKKEVGVYPLPNHLAEMASVGFDVAKKQ